MMSKKNRFLASILILMGAAMLSSCTSVADAGAAATTADTSTSICAYYEA